MSIKYLLQTTLILLIIMLAGCKASEINELAIDHVSSQEENHAEQLQENVEPVYLPVTLTLEKVKDVFQQPLTKEQVREIFGVPKSSGETYRMMNGKYTLVNQASYESVKSNSKLIIQWSKEWELLYAVFYDDDSSGHRMSYMPAVGNMKDSSSKDNRIANDNGITLDENVTVYKSTNAYEWWGGKQAIRSQSVSANKSYNVITLSEDFAEIEDESGYGGWVPVWYLTQEATKSEDIEPLSLTASEDISVLWYPNSGSVAATIKAGETLYAYEELEDWYGVIIADSEDYDRTFGLLWVSKQQVLVQGSAPEWFQDKKQDSDQSGLIAATVRGILVPGVETARVQAILGEPSFKEYSENVAEYDEKARSLPLWRYEDSQNELNISWTEEGTLRYALYRNLSGVDTHIGWDGVNIVQGPFVPSQQMNWDWRFRSDLAYNFLLDKIGNVLLVAGEDGGFSGMHMNSSVYALNSKNGRQIWQFDLGPEAHYYGLSADKSRIAFMKRIMQEDVPVYKLQTIRLDNGATIWEKTLNNGRDITSFTVSNNIIATVQYERIDYTEAYHYFLVGWSIKDGNQLWSIDLTASSTLSRDVGNQGVLLVQSEVDSSPAIMSELYAYDPLTGELLWKKSERQAATDQDLTDGALYAEHANAFWTKTTQELVLTEAKTGKDLLRLPLTDYSRYDIINEQYVFLQQSSESNWSNVNVKSSLVDVHSGKTIFTVEGRADFGNRDGNILYYSLNGVPTSFDLQKGETRWQPSSFFVESATGTPTVTYNGQHFAVFPAIGNLYMLDDATGKAVTRISDVRVGYYDFTSNQLLKGYLTVIDDKLYIGSSNGFFSKVK